VAAGRDAVWHAALEISLSQVSAVGIVSLEQCQARTRRTVAPSLL